MLLINYLYFENMSEVKAHLQDVSIIFCFIVENMIRNMAYVYVM